MHARQSLVSLAGEVWSASFKAHFVAFWLFAQSKQLRISRLDATQHAAIHNLNSATRLAGLLDEPVALRVQRSVLANPSAGILTLSEVAAELGLECSSSHLLNGGGARCAEDGARLIGECGPVAAARLLSYARAAWLSEQILIVDLGQRAHAMQSSALRRRLGADEGTPLEDLTKHAYSLCLCCECKRAANAIATCESSQSFNELGVSACQLAVDAPPGVVRLHCAKRSSAALRSAISFEEVMKKQRVEFQPVDRAALTRLTALRNSKSDTGVASRVRRDSKCAFEQLPRAIACGAHPMVQIPIIGRAIRVFGQWYGLCCLCAAIIEVKVHLHRFSTDLCCLRCDEKLILGKEKFDILETKKVDAKICRFCGSVDPERSGAKWTRFQAPKDVAGPNANIPAPLRKIYLCPAHFRPWVAAAVRVLETRVILSHIAHNARPLFGGDVDDGTELSTPQNDGGGGARKKKRRLKTNHTYNVG